MRKVQFLSFLFFLLAVVQCFGQQTTWSTPYYNRYAVWSGVANLSTDHLISIDGVHISNFAKGSSTDHHLTVYDKELKVVREVPISFELGKEKLLHQFVVQSKNDYYVFASTWDSKTDKNTLYFQRLDHQTLSPKGGLKKVLETVSGTARQNGRMDFRYSPDSSKILVYSNPFLKKDEPEQFEFVVFDRDMNPIWTRKATLPYEERQNRINDAVVDNNGNVFIMDEEGYVDDRFCGGCPTVNSNHIVFAFSQDSEKPIELLLDPGDKHLVNMKFHFNSKEELICVGFSAKDASTHVSGVYFLKINTKSKEVIEAKDSSFGLEKPFYLYVFRQIIPIENGGYILLGEYYDHIRTETAGANGASYPSHEYTFDNILIVGIDNSGGIKWQTEIPKHQHSTNNGGVYSSFGAMAFDDHIMLIYNDHIDNLGVDFGKNRPKNFGHTKKKGVVVQADVTFDGKITQKKLFGFDELDVILYPKMFIRIDEEHMLMFGGKKGFTQFGIMTF